MRLLFNLMEKSQDIFIQRIFVLVQDSENIWIPQTTECEEMVTTEFKQLDVDKFCSVPAFFQNSKVTSDDMLLL